MTDKKIKNFYGNNGLIAQVSDEFRDIFQSQLKERGQKQKDVLIASIRIWMDLPLEVQAKLIDQSTDESYLNTIVENIVDKKLSEKLANWGVESAVNDAGGQPKRQGKRKEPKVS